MDWRRPGGARALGAAMAVGKLIAAVLSLISSVRGAEYFVSTSGDNNNPGSASSPWRTLQFAADRMGAGDRVVVRAGTYAGFYFDADGTESSPVEFFAEPGVLINQRNPTTNDGINLEGSSWVVVDGFEVSNNTMRAGVRAVLGDHVTIRRVKAYNNLTWGIFTGFVDDLLIENNETWGSIEEHGIYVSNSGDRPVLRGNVSYDNYGSGIHMNGDASEGGDGIISGALITGNRIYNNSKPRPGQTVGLGGSGINMDGVQNSRIENNLLYNNHASGISLYRIDGGGGSTGNVVINNTVHQPSDGRWALNIRDESTGNTVLNNIFVTDHSFRGSISVETTSLPGMVSDYNVVQSRFTTNQGSSVLTLAQWQSATPHDDHSLLATAATLFVNPAAGDYRLKAGAAALNQGTNTLAPSVDFFGQARPQGGAIDVGAIESSALGADFNGDNVVDESDLALWRSGFGAAVGAGIQQGNADGDQDVDGHDFLAWQQQRGAGLGATAVAEPGGGLLAVAGGVLLVWGRRQRGER